MRRRLCRRGGRCGERRQARTALPAEIVGSPAPFPGNLTWPLLDPQLPQQDPREGCWKWGSNYDGLNDPVYAFRGAL